MTEANGSLADHSSAACTLAVTGGLTPSSRRVRAQGLSLHCLVWGRGDNPPAFLLHGAAAHAHWWDALVPTLISRWQLIALDLRGHGSSDWAESPRYQIADFAGDLTAVVDAFTKGPVVLVGHSMGGRVCTWYAANYPDRVRGLALLDSRITSISPDRALMARAVVPEQRQGRGYPTRQDAMAAFHLVPPEPAVDPAILENLAYHAVHERQPGMWALRFDRAVLALEGDRGADLSEMSQRLRCPAIVLHGEQSPVLEAGQRGTATPVLAGCDVQLMPGGHHFPLSHPDLTAGVLKRFLDRLG